MNEIRISMAVQEFFAGGKHCKFDLIADGESAEQAIIGRSRYCQQYAEEHIRFTHMPPWRITWLEWWETRDGNYRGRCVVWIAENLPLIPMKYQDQTLVFAMEQIRRNEVQLRWALQAIETLALSADEVERRELAAEAHRRSQELRR